MTTDSEFFRILLEVFKTKENLVWDDQSGLSITSFVLGGQQYGITIREDSANGVTFYEVAFTANNPSSRSHSATNFNKNQFKILGIVSNGIKEKIDGADLIYFTAKLDTAKLNTDDDSKNANIKAEYQSKVSLYSRIAHKIAVELSMYEGIVSLGDETVFVIAKTQQLLNSAKQGI